MPQVIQRFPAADKGRCPYGWGEEEANAGAQLLCLACLWLLERSSSFKRILWGWGHQTGQHWLSGRTPEPKCIQCQQRSLQGEMVISRNSPVTHGIKRILFPKEGQFKLPRTPWEAVSGPATKVRIPGYVGQTWLNWALTHLWCLIVSTCNFKFYNF